MRGKKCISLKFDTLCYPLKHVHHDTPLLRVTSNVPVSEAATFSVLDRMLCSELGCYFYPEDAVVEFKDSKDPFVSMQEMMMKWREDCKGGDLLQNLHHMSVNINEFEEVEEKEVEVEEEEDEEGGEEEEEELEEKEWSSDDEGCIKSV